MKSLCSTKTDMFRQDYKFFCFHGQPFMIQVDIDKVYQTYAATLFY